MGNFKETVCAVVVTYNRKELLKRCLNALWSQTRLLDDIIVINNGSTDGTTEWLKEQKNIITINQDNIGGAGGFYTGIKFAYDQGYSWIWCMDDDGYPLNNVLQNLIDKAKKYNIKVIAPCVIPRLDSENVSFGYAGSRSIKYLTTLSDSNGIILGEGNLFNGILINKLVVKEVGFPDYRLFIKGDEKEYKYRITKRFIIALDMKSYFIHPDLSEFNTALAEYFPFNKITVYLSKSNFKNYYFIRNGLILLKRTSKIYILPYYIFKYMFISILNFNNSAKMKTIFIAIIDGIFNNYNRNIK